MYIPIYYDGVPLDFYLDFSLSVLPIFLGNTFLSTFFGLFFIVFSLHFLIIGNTRTLGVNNS
jgi:hypothetical protein